MKIDFRLLQPAATDLVNVPVMNTSYFHHYKHRIEFYDSPLFLY